MPEPTLSGASLWQGAAWQHPSRTTCWPRLWTWRWMSRMNTFIMSPAARFKITTPCSGSILVERRIRFSMRPRAAAASSVAPPSNSIRPPRNFTLLTRARALFGALARTAPALPPSKPMFLPPPGARGCCLPCRSQWSTSTTAVPVRSARRCLTAESSPPFFSATAFSPPIPAWFNSPRWALRLLALPR